MDVNNKLTNSSSNGKVKNDRKIALITGITGQVFKFFHYYLKVISILFKSLFITFFHHFIYQIFKYSNTFYTYFNQIY